MTTTRRARIRTLALFLLLPLLAGACDRDTVGLEPPEDWQENLTPSDPDTRFLAADANTGIEQSRRLVLRSEADWLEVWELWNIPVEPKPELPAVDFATEMVIVAAMGSRPSSGFAIGVDTVVEEPTRVLINTFTVRPGGDCFVLGVITAPAVAVAIRTTQKPVSFTNTAYVHDCD